MREFRVEKSDDIFLFDCMLYIHNKYCLLLCQMFKNAAILKYIVHFRTKLCDSKCSRNWNVHFIFVDYVWETVYDHNMILLGKSCRKHFIISISLHNVINDQFMVCFLFRYSTPKCMITCSLAESWNVE